MDKLAVYEIRVFPWPQKAAEGVMPAGRGSVAVHYIDAGDVHRCVSMPSGALDRPCSELFQMLPDYPHDRECRPMLKAWLRHQGLGEDVADQMVLGEVVYG